MCPAGLGQLLVWEWQSESYVLKQQGHFNSMVSLAYSPDGQYIVTGGDDSKVGRGGGEGEPEGSCPRSAGLAEAGCSPWPGPDVGFSLELQSPPRLIWLPEKPFADLPGLSGEALGVPFWLCFLGTSKGSVVPAAALRCGRLPPAAPQSSLAGAPPWGVLSHGATRHRSRCGTPSAASASSLSRSTRVGSPA